MRPIVKRKAESRKLTNWTTGRRDYGTTGPQTKSRPEVGTSLHSQHSTSNIQCSTRGRYGDATVSALPRGGGSGKETVKLLPMQHPGEFLPIPVKTQAINDHGSSSA